MINIIPQSEVRLLKTPLEKDEEHTLSWSSLADQTAYMLSRVQHTYNDFTYIRETQALVVPANYDAIYTCNYLMYKNNGFNNKYFYAFITKMEYVSENSTRIYFEIDSLQTWYFQINYNNVFIEREHVDNDAIGANTIPEALESGEYIESGATKYNGFGIPAVVMCSSIDVKNLNYPHGRYYSGLYTGNCYYFFGVIGEDHPTPQNQYMAVNDCLEYMSGKVDNVQSLFMCPENILDYEDLYPTAGGNWKILNENRQTAVNEVGTSFEDPITLADFNCYRPTSIGSFVPRNNKLLCFPYNYLMLSNNNGANGIYHYEDFGYDPNYPNMVRFNVKGICSPGCSIRCYPKSYKGVSDNYTVGISAGKFPVCNWATDAYTNWLTQNSVNMGIGVAGNLMTTAGGIAVSGANPAIGIPMVLSSAVNIGSELKEVYNKQYIPNECNGDVGSGDIAFSTQNNTFVFHQFQIKEEFARIIDDYFNKFGYKVNRVKTPNINSRRNFNYIKTIGCNFTGDIPQEDLEKIKGLFNNGITFWHNAENFLNYSVNNDII